MKCLFCTACLDVQRMYPAPRTCQCGKSSGRYTGEHTVEVTGKGIVLGLDNGDIKLGAIEVELGTRTAVPVSAHLNPLTAKNIKVKGGVGV